MREAQASLVAALAGFAVVFALVALLAALGHDWEAALRDGALSEADYAGSITVLGVVLVLVTGVAALVRGGPPGQRMAVFCAAFAIDDYFMVHENLPTPEALLFAGIGVLFALAWQAEAAARGTWRIWPFAVALGCFAVSLGFDMIYLRLQPVLALSGPFGTLMEDSAKFAGIVVLLVFAVGEARARRG